MNADSKAFLGNLTLLLKHAVPAELNQHRLGIFGLAWEEAAIFQPLVRNIDVCSYDEIASAICDQTGENLSDQAIIANVHRIRKKVAAQNIHICARKGVGYWVPVETKARVLSLFGLDDGTPMNFVKPLSPQKLLYTGHQREQA
jgi:hypothetical protein